MTDKQDLLEQIVLGEIQGKNRAIHAYDGLVWKIRQLPGRAAHLDADGRGWPGHAGGSLGGRWSKCTGARCSPASSWASRRSSTPRRRAIAGLKCYQCGAPFEALRSFKRHNRAYAMPALLKALQTMKVEQTS